uniref:DNA-binding protein Hu-like protein n=1 Tax=Galdieria phlegrea TaxID=1389228 RepID=UPI0023D877B7|nr:DNA-binding protein Hu-like protein [Galdieria phlegrea]UNJ16213.1 DNA-binding protein Hu-like protein [Galdieria sp.]WDA99545.1 DNA-binding protein Hu-like protein [Galdieria sulphuraria]WDA99735.1 DNA-binding protein Hu-like protein [Galdieria phlegrea]
MNKSDLSEELAKRAKITKKLANEVITLFTDIVREKVNEGKKVTIVGFGTFKAKYRKPKAVRNPRTEKRMIIPASRVPVFTVGKLFKEEVNNKFLDSKNDIEEKEEKIE